jgi:YHS domain-containing protein
MVIKEKMFLKGVIMKMGKWMVFAFLLASFAFLATLLNVFTAEAGCGGGSPKSVSCSMPGHNHSPDMKHDPNHEPNMDVEKTCSSEMMQKYRFLATMPIYMDSPMVIYARAPELGLSEEQKAKLLAITAESRKNSLAILTVEQRQKLGVIPDEPMTMLQICPMMHSEAGQQPAAVQATADNKVVEQTTCPVMGGTVNKALFVEYKGKKVYFCCADCKTEFEKNPEKYIGKLPQFAKQKQ